MIKVGDRVIAIAQSDNNFRIIGKIGEIINVSDDQYDGLTHNVDFKINISPFSTDIKNWWCDIRTLRKITTNERS